MSVEKFENYNNKTKSHVELLNELTSKIQEIYNNSNSNLTNEEAIEAANNLMRFYKKMIDIEIRIAAEENKHLEPG